MTARRFDDAVVFQIRDHCRDHRVADIASGGEIINRDVEIRSKPENAMHQIFQSPNARGVGINEILQHREIVGTDKTFAVRRHAVTTRTTDLLRMVFQTLGHVVMDHRADVRLVDAHAESNRRHDHARLAIHEGRLRCGTEIIGQSRMIGRCRQPLRLEKGRHFLGSFLSRDIDHSRALDR